MSDATPVYRGYRRQALYTLHRLLRPDANSRTFQPEGQEDLAVFDGDRLIEAIQVKDYSADLTLSDLASKTESRSSFLHRAAELIRFDPQIRITLASFGPVGPELRQALTGDGTRRKKVTRKLVDEYGFSTEDAAAVLEAVRIDFVQEDLLTEGAFAILRGAVTGADPESAFDLLSYWLYICAESQERLTSQIVLDRINSVGRSVSRRSAHHLVWFSSVVPIEKHEVFLDERSGLADEFYRGVGARYEHVLAGLDVPRPGKVVQITAGFGERNIVILHGASGQGKTTLAYRYLLDVLPHAPQYRVHAIENRQHALQIASALEGYADVFRGPTAVFIDVSPKDGGWPDLVERLSRHPHMRVLVAVREEDWRSATITDSDAIRDVEFTFDRSEAEGLYSSLIAQHVSPVFLGFEDAWSRFGGEGPLLEFIYLVTQGALLRERLRDQVSRLSNDANRGSRSAGELYLLRLVAVASAFDGHLRVKAVANHLQMPALGEAIRLLEEEYLVRQSQGGALLGGLHPIRSSILVDLLTDADITPWSDIASIALAFLDERDLETFLLHTFSRRLEDAPVILKAVSSLQPATWVGTVGVLRAVLWLGMREYADANRTLIDDASRDSGPGWSVVLDADIAEAIPGFAASMWDGLGGVVTEERRQQISDLRARQTPKSDAFVHATQWLQVRTEPLQAPDSLEEWVAAAEVMYWIGRLDIKWPLEDWLSEGNVSEALGTLPLYVAADLVAGLEEGYAERFPKSLQATRSLLRERFQRETQTLVLSEYGQRITAHFIIDPDTSREQIDTVLSPALDAKNPLHNEALKRVSLMRRLFPEKELYACQGYGHRPPALQLPSDDTRKTGIPRAKLPLRWPVSMNAAFSGLVTYSMRPEDWQEYAIQVVGLREEVVRCLTDLKKALPAYLSSPNPIRILGTTIPSLEWYRRWRVMRDPPHLPRCAVDEWGFIHESLVESAAASTRENGSTELARIPSLRRHRALLDAVRSYAQAFHNFLLQAPGVMTNNATYQKGHSGARGGTGPGGADAETREVADRRLSTLNLAETWKVPPELQRQYRQLLGIFIPRQRLDDLERRESDLFPTVWPLWYAFAVQPGVVLGQPVRDAADRLSRVKRQLKSALQRELRQFPSDATQVSVLSEDVRWESEPVLWIGIDGIDGVEVYNALESLLNAVRQAILSVPDENLRRYALDLYWRHIVVVPLLRNRSLAGMAWRVHTDTLVNAASTDSLGWWNFVQQTIPIGAQHDLGVSIWEDPRLALGAKLANVVSQLWPLVVHVADLTSLPELDGVGEEMGLQHVANMIARVNQSAQPVVDTVSELATSMSDLNLHKEAPQAVGIAVDALRLLISAIQPTDDHQGVSTVQVRDFEAWAIRLSEGLAHAQIAQLAWATAVLADTDS